MRARVTRVTDSTLVAAACAGDSAARDELFRTHLPLVYSVARRALSESSDVDDVVQDIFLRALRQLPQLRDQERFRPWLMTIALRQISTHLEQERLAGRRTTGLDEVVARPDAEFEGVRLLRVELVGQRRQLMDAGRWLAPEEQALLPLWWLETSGELTRADLAAAAGLSVAHAGVRLQRLRQHLDLSRSVVAALEVTPGCPRLGTVLRAWDGVPSPFWRKRIARHLRSCGRCAGAAEGLLPADRLLAGLALLPVPAVLAAAIGKVALTGGAVGAPSTVALVGAGTGSGSAKVWSLSRVVQAAGTHPVAASVTAGVLAIGIPITTTGWSSFPAPVPVVITDPTPAPTASTTPITPPPSASPPPSSPSGSATERLKVGAASLESSNQRGRFVAVASDAGILAAVGADGGGTVRPAVTFTVVPGLADPNCFSFRTSDGQLLRHSSWRLRPARDEGTVLFRGDATFCVRVGSVPGSVSLESSNYPGWFLRHVGDELWVDQFDGSAGFRADSSFLVRPPQG